MRCTLIYESIDPNTEKRTVGMVGCNDRRWDPISSKLYQHYPDGDQEIWRRCREGFRYQPEPHGLCAWHAVNRRLSNGKSYERNGAS